MVTKDTEMTTRILVLRATLNILDRHEEVVGFFIKAL